MLLNELLIEILVLIGVVWLVAVTFVLWRRTRFSSRLNKEAGRRDVKSILERFIKRQEEIDRHIREIESALGSLEKKTEKHIQKVGVVRFSPFKETGGNQSFALALLDEDSSGVVLLSLHGREGTRIYVKPVNNGKSRYELSKEEIRAIEGAEK